MFVGLDQVIRANAERLFPGMLVASASLFRVCRDADVELDENDGLSKRAMVEEELRQRRFEPVVRLEVQPDADAAMVAELVDRFALAPDAVYEMSALLDYTTLFEIAGLDVAELRDPPWTPLAPRVLEAAPDSDIFSAIRSADILLHHPYESFYASVERFIREAADDPQTLSIKMTVYRVGDDTPFVRSLIAAAEAGKQVACVIELNARFDEERNLHWSRELERVGAHVMFGVTGLKTHSKVALVVRNEDGVIRSYAHIGTGNYHTRTAKLYEDVGLLTADPVITGDVVSLFHYLTGRSRTPSFSELLVAPLHMRARFVELLEAEIANHEAGRPARIVCKMNQLEDPEMCALLSRASGAGVPVDLIVRGLCCLAPGVPGLTENLRIRSVIGRFLEHSRIFHFASGSEDPLEGTFLIGSADWMTRNLSERVEAAVPITKPRLRARLWEILEICLADRRNAWELQSDGSYIQLQPDPYDAAGQEGTHATLMRLATERNRVDGAAVHGRGRRRVSAGYAHPVGVSMGDMVPPEQIGEKARWLEGLGYSHIMIPEDYFYVPALVGATLALQATESVPVGTSIVSGLVRHPAVLAMEIAGISRAFPGRFRPGIGLGLPDWLRQMGIMPAKPVAALRESVTSVRRLLAGETDHRRGQAFLARPDRHHAPCHRACADRDGRERPDAAEPRRGAG